MYKVMLVEDELLVRVGLQSLIDWESLGMEIVAEFANGQSAFEQYNVICPDIIITDIRMPLLDGINLIEKIRAIDENVRIIVLSCLDDFPLVQSALNLGISSYIHKLTMSSDELSDALLKAKKQLAKNHRNCTPVKPPAETVFSQYLHNSVAPHTFVQLIEDRQLKAPLCAALLVLDTTESIIPDENEECGEQPHKIVKGILKQVFDIKKTGLWCQMSDRLFFYTTSATHMDAATDHIRSLLDVYMDTAVDIWFSSRFQCPLELSSIYVKLLGINDIGYVLRSSGREDLNDLSPSINIEIRLVRDYIWLNYTQPISVQTIADTISYSPNYLSAIFKKNIGVGIIDYLTYVRIEMSKLLLRETKKSILEISEEAGFNYESYFSRCFKEYTGMTPSSYRKKKL